MCFVASLTVAKKGCTYSNWRDQFLDRDAADAWLTQYRTRLMQESNSDAERAAQMNHASTLNLYSATI